MKIAVYYFSATGNTKKLASLYKQRFEELGHECELFTIPQDKDKKIDLSGFDMLGIGYPIHAFNAPKIVLKFAKQLTKRKDKLKTFIFKTSGEPVKMSKVSSLKLIKILKRRGYEATNEYQYIMPYNMIFRHTDHMAYTMWQTAQKLAPVDVDEILNGIAHKEDKLFLGGLWAWFMRVEHWGAHVNGWFYKADKKKCIGCGKCAKNCPVKNIEMKDGVPKFKSRCIMCAKCSFFCPVNCIRIGLFNSWRINGEYSFKDGDPNEKNGHENYCKKAYDRYFKNAEERINSASETH